MSQVSLPIFVVTGVVCVEDIFWVGRVDGLVGVVVLFAPYVLVDFTTTGGSIILNIVSVVFIFLFIFLTPVTGGGRGF